MADDNDSRSVSHCLEAAAVGSSLHSRSNIPASNKEEASFVFQHDSSLVEKPGFFLLSSPSVAFSVVLHELQGIANKSTWEKSQCEFVIYQNHISSVYLQLLRKLVSWKETKLNVILSFSLFILNPNGFLDPLQLKTPLGIVAAHRAAGVGTGDQCSSG